MKLKKIPFTILRIKYLEINSTKSTKSTHWKLQNIVEKTVQKSWTKGGTHHALGSKD